MILQKVILSSNDNPEYIDFWPGVAKAWREIIGIEPVLFFIGDQSKVESLSKHGQVIRVNPLSSWDIVNQSQSIRLWAGTKFPNDNLIISDLDMLPINKDYFVNNALNSPDDSLISYTSDVLKYGFYLRVPQLPMCYLAAKGSTFNQILEIDENTSWESFAKSMQSRNLGYGTDQRFFYEKFLKWPQKNERYIGLERGWIGGKIAVNRLDKVAWAENEAEYPNFYDCHLPRPFSGNVEKINKLYKALDLI
jgi:hypothetical protein